MLITIIIFFLILGLLIFVHEMGHFIAAKRAGAKVEEFGMGLPPRIFGIKRGETIYSINWLPIGGFCKILGEEGEGKDNSRSMASMPVGARAKIFAAGVAMNFLLAIVLLIIGYSIGLPTAFEENQTGTVIDPKVQIQEIVKDSPAEMAGLQVGDAIVKIKKPSFVPNGTLKNKQEFEEKNIGNVKDVQNFVGANKGEEIILEIKRGKEILEIAAVPKENSEGVGILGIGLVKTGIVSYPIHKAIWMGIATTINLVIMIIVLFSGFLWNLIVGAPSGLEVAGPVGIAVLTGQMVDMGFVYILQFTALISINLALINIFPFPALDGGHLLFLGIEKIKGQPVKKELLNKINNAGFAFLLFLILFITAKDFAKFDILEKMKGIF